ncbi:dTMP kinase [Bifidobacterium magnum]|uniref:Thymidylate kinase n=1 Tax=Bifidobacterium magnum TaxID=1692 RepID=A0A087BAV8_9BIFI|nr:dTMP kinase [Bifidobacterium magnum]KFI68158.1 Thymidylate kinase [Bifidobacterium magnum]
MTEGLFISFEGVDGAGKTTQVRKLADRLRAQGRTVVTTREPGGTPIGARIRAMLLTKDYESAAMGERTEALLFAADRAQHAAETIRPAIESGAIVITDRYLDSSVAYQAGGRELGQEEIRNLSLWATNNLLPDRTYLLDIDPAVSHTRFSGPEDRMESAGDDFQIRTRREFLKLAEREPQRFRIIDATQSVDDIAAQIAADMDSLMAARN